MASIARAEPPSRLAVGLARLRPGLLMVLIAGGLAALPFPTCGMRVVLGIPCPGCGMTRAVLAAARLDWAASMRWHPLALPLLVVAGAMAVLAFVVGDVAWRRLLVAVTTTASMTMLLVWALRFAGLFGGPVPG
jgi:Protein of unknown function (DUF2752)